MMPAAFAGLLVFFLFTLSNIPTPLYVIWQRDWGFSSGTLTVVFSGTYVAAIMLSLLIVGRLADLYGRRPVLVAGAVCACLASVVFLMSDGVSDLLLGRFLSGITIACTVTAGMAACVDLAPLGRKASGSLFATIGLVSGAGFGPLLAGFISPLSGKPQIPVFITMLVISVLALAITLLLPLSLPSNRHQKRQLLPALPRVPRGFGKVLIWATATASPGMTVAAFMAGLAPSVLANLLHQSNSVTAGIIVCSMFIAGTVAQIPVKRLDMRAQLAVGPICALLAMAIVTICVTIAPNVELFALAAILCGIAQGTGQLAAVTLIGTAINQIHRSESNAALNLVSYIPTEVLPILCGYAADGIGLAWACLAFAIFIIAITASCLVFTQRTYHRRAGAEADWYVV
ncbi:MAG: MFS transporter [Bifidobacterium sp.]|jgi:MFS family permease|nr:MFS transporter [Bifidobacterium sp.]